MNTIIENALHEINKNLSTNLDNIEFTGKIIRFGEKKECWYAANQWEYKGNNYFTINYGSWKNGTEFLYKSFDQKQALDKNFIKAQKKKTEENQAKLKHEKETLQKQCSEKWTPKFKQASSQGEHEYLINKGIKNLYSARIDHNGTLLIPVYDHEGKINGVQMIFKDPETQTMVKRFARGIKIKGGICPLKRFKDAEYVYLSEGFATAASIQMSFPNIPSICAFNAGNLAEAINTIRFVNPSCKILLAADNDANHEGEKKAKYCTKIFADVVYKKVIFPTDSPREWSDFNDLHCFQGLSELKPQLEIEHDDFFEVHFLGCSEKKNSYYIVSSQNKQIMNLKDSDLLNKSKLFKVASRSWFLKQPEFVTKSKPQNEDEEPKLTINWESVAEIFTQRSLEQGFFNPKKIRGLGIWRDGENYIFNNGKNIYPTLNKNNLNFFYNEVHTKDDSFEIKDPMSFEEMQYIYDGLKKLTLANCESAAYIAAWLLQANIFHVFKKRFHLWITGETSSGKSWIQEEVFEKVVYNLNRSKNSSAASIYLSVADNVTPIVFDESEPSKNGILSLIEMARDATDSDGATKERFGQNGEIVRYKAICLFAFGSVQMPELKPQDKNRFFVADVIPQKVAGQTEEEWAYVQNMVQWLQENKSRFFARCFNRIPTILKHERMAYKYLKEKKIFNVTRTTELTAVMIACLSEFVTENLTEEIIDIMVERLNLKENEYVQNAKVDAATECYNALMSMEVDTYGQRTVSFCLEILNDNIKTTVENDPTNEIIRILSAHGMRYYPQEKELFIAAGSEKIKKKIKDYPDYVSVLRRSESICKKKIDTQLVKGYAPKATKGIRVKVDFAQ